MRALSAIPAHPADLLAGAAWGDRGRPVLTGYDDVRGERVELSVATLANWVAKTAGLFTDVIGATAGDVVAVRLPLHWQQVAVVLGAWTAGLTVDLDGDPAGAAVLAVDEPGLATAPAGPEVVGLSLSALGGPLADPPPDVLDYALEVRACADRYIPRRLAGPALTGPDGGTPAADLLRRAVRLAGEAGLDRSAVLLTVRPWSDPAELLAGLLGPLAGGCRLVLCRTAGSAGPDPGLLAERAVTERVSATLGVDLPGLPRLDQPPAGR